MPKHQFKKGNKHRREMNSDLMTFRLLTQKSFMEVLRKYLTSTPAELRMANEDPDTPAIDRAVISVIVKTIEHGDPMRLEALLRRIIGRPPEEAIGTEERSEIVYVTEWANARLEEKAEHRALLSDVDET